MAAHSSLISLGNVGLFLLKSIMVFNHSAVLYMVSCLQVWVFSLLRLLRKVLNQTSVCSFRRAIVNKLDITLKMNRY